MYYEVFLGSSGCQFDFSYKLSRLGDSPQVLKLAF
jgi:hypothetical protein